MHRRPIVTLAAALILCACSSEPVPVAKWSKPGADQRSFLEVQARCVRFVRSQSSAFYAAGLRSQGSGGALGEFADDMLADFGWRATVDGLDSDSFQRCMSAHGWSRDPTGFAPPAGEEVATGH